jgi:hypothetical protein
MISVFDGLNFPQRVLMILLLACIVSVFTFVLFRLLSGKKVSFNLKEGQLSYSPEKDSTSMAALGSGIFFLTFENVSFMAQIKTKIILHDQMTYLEEKLVIVRDKILESYRGLLKGKLSSTGAGLGQEYLFFQTLVDLLVEDMKSSIRTLFIRNHFSTYNDKELEGYIAEKNQLLMVKAYQFLRDMYPSEKMVIPFDDIEDALDLIRKDLEQDISYVFKRAVDITKARHRQIEELEVSLRDKIKSNYGVDIGERRGRSFADIVKSGVPDGTERNER